MPALQSGCHSAWPVRAPAQVRAGADAGWPALAWQATNAHEYRRAPTQDDGEDYHDGQEEGVSVARRPIGHPARCQQRLSVRARGWLLLMENLR